MQSTTPRFIPALRFHRLTPAYDVLVRTTTREATFKRALIEQARIEPGQRVLDLACGTGTLAIWIRQQVPGAQVVGIDADRRILELARKKARRAGVQVHFDHGRSEALPYGDCRFDRVLSSLFFHHLSWEQKQRTAAEVWRVLKPGGELHFADWGRPAHVLMRLLFVSVQVLDGFANTQDNVEGKLIPLLQEAGFTDVSQQRTFSTIYGTLALYRAARPA